MSMHGGILGGFVSVMSLMYVSECYTEPWSCMDPWDTGEDW
jgi:prolipoprotein diacylglyceryltransferase